MNAKDLTDALGAAFSRDSRWDEIRDGERVNGTTITAFPFDSQP